RTHDDTGVCERHGAGVCAAKPADLRPDPTSPEEGVEDVRRHVPACQDLAAVIDLLALNLGDAHITERREGLMIPEDDLRREYFGGPARPDDLAASVDARRLADRSAERAQVGHDSVLPEESVWLARFRETLTNNLTALIDRPGGALCAAQCA